MTIRDQIDQKKDELIKHLYKWLNQGKRMNYHQWYTKKCEIESELASLRLQEEKEVSDEDIEKASYQFLSDVAMSTNTERKYERLGFIKGVKAHRDNLITK